MHWEQSFSILKDRKFFFFLLFFTIKTQEILWWIGTLSRDKPWTGCPGFLLQYTVCHSSQRLQSKLDSFFRGDPWEPGYSFDISMAFCLCWKILYFCISVDPLRLLLISSDLSFWIFTWHILNHFISTWFLPLSVHVRHSQILMADLKVHMSIRESTRPRTLLKAWL